MFSKNERDKQIKKLKNQKDNILPIFNENYAGEITRDLTRPEDALKYFDELMEEH